MVPSPEGLMAHMRSKLPITTSLPAILLHLYPPTPSAWMPQVAPGLVRTGGTKGRVCSQSGLCRREWRCFL